MILSPIYKLQFFFCFAPQHVGTASLIVSGAYGRVITILVFSFHRFPSLSLRHISLTGTNALQYVPKLYPHG